MAVTAVTGEIGSGKSTVSHILADMKGCECLDADVLAKALWLRPDVKARAVERWGDSVLGPDGELVLSAVAEKVFSSAKEHSFCNRLIHPLVMYELKVRVQGMHDAVVEIPLLPEAGRQSWIDRAFYVTAKFGTRAERCRVRGWNAQELLRRESFLLPQPERTAVCEVIIRNDGSIEELQRQLKENK